MATVESKSRIPDILGDLEIPAGRIFYVQKEDVWSPYSIDFMLCLNDFFPPT